MRSLRRARALLDRSRGGGLAVRGLHRTPPHAPRRRLVHWGTFGHGAARRSRRLAPRPGGRGGSTLGAGGTQQVE